MFNDTYTNKFSSAVSPDECWKEVSWEIIHSCSTEWSGSGGLNSSIFEAKWRVNNDFPTPAIHKEKLVCMCAGSWRNQQTCQKIMTHHLQQGILELRSIVYVRIYLEKCEEFSCSFPSKWFEAMNFSKHDALVLANPWWTNSSLIVMIRFINQETTHIQLPMTWSSSNLNKLTLTFLFRWDLEKKTEEPSNLFLDGYSPCWLECHIVRLSREDYDNRRICFHYLTSLAILREWNDLDTNDDANWDALLIRYLLSFGSLLLHCSNRLDGFPVDTCWSICRDEITRTIRWDSS